MINVSVYGYKAISLLRGVITTLANKIRLRLNGASYGKGFRTQGLLFVRNGMGGGIILGNNVKINSCRKANPTGALVKTTLFTWRDGKICIGNNVGISCATIIATQSVTIEDDCMIGGGCQIYDTDHHSVIPEFRIKGNTHIPSAPVIIKRGSFLGSDVKVLKGVTIGKYSVVGADSVVTKSIPDMEIWAGNPARFIKKIPNR